MPILGHRSTDLFVRAGDENLSGTFVHHVDPPTSVSAQVSLHMVRGDAVHHIGIRSFHHLDGIRERVVDFSPHWWNWPSTIGHDRVTRVTFGVFASKNNDLRGHADVYFWG